MRAGAALWLVMVACKPVREAPADVDAALHDLWSAYAADDQDGLLLVLQTLPAILDLDSLADASAWQDGQMGPLTAEEMSLAEGSNMVQDPASAVPLYTISRYPCSLEHHERILVYHDQNELYGVYDAYERAYIDDPAAFLAGDTSRAEWRGDIDATIPTLGAYSYGFRTGIRRVAGDDGVALVTRTFMERVAVWDNETPKFNQDYQIEAFLPVDGDVVHLYGVWREMELGWMGDMNDTVVARTTINQMFKWDRTTIQLCADGVPAQSP